MFFEECQRKTCMRSVRATFPGGAQKRGRKESEAGLNSVESLRFRSTGWAGNALSQQQELSVGEIVVQDLPETAALIG